MNVARILYPVKVLGPGDRIGIWLCGCTRRCIGCSNPELWEQQERYEIALADLKSLISDIADMYKVDGFTITGGEPVEQAEELLQLVHFLSNVNMDILVYSGYTYRELRALRSKHINRLLGSISVLVDGEYIERQNEYIPLRGSKNQQVIILNPQYKEKYETLLSTVTNQVQNFTTVDGVVSAGIHRRDFSNSILERIYGNNRGKTHG